MKDILKAVELEIERRQLTPEDISNVLKQRPEAQERRIIGGYGSVSVVDREGHRITIPALKDAVHRFMAEQYSRNVMVFHSDVQVGRVIPKWTEPDSGKTFTTHVDDKGFYCLVELRDDVEIADKVWQEIIKGNLRSFSIAGSSKDKQEVQERGQTFYNINKLDLYEVTICEEPVNQLSKFDVLWNPDRIII